MFINMSCSNIQYKRHEGIKGKLKLWSMLDLTAAVYDHILQSVHTSDDLN